MKPFTPNTVEAQAAFYIQYTHPEYHIQPIAYSITCENRCCHSASWVGVVPPQSPSFVYLNTYTYTCTFTYTYMHVYLNLYTYTHTYIPIPIRKNTYAYTYAYTFTYTYILSFTYISIVLYPKPTLNKCYQ